MNIWQLDSIFEGDMTLPIKVSGSRCEWDKLTKWFESIGEYRKQGNRDILDYDLPHELIVDIFRQSNKHCYKTKSGLLMSNKCVVDDEAVSTSGNELITAEDVIKKYGSSILEQVFEKGAVTLEEKEKNKRCRRD